MIPPSFLIKTDTYGVPLMRMMANSTLADNDATSVINIWVSVGGVPVFSQIVQVCGRFEQGKGRYLTSTEEPDTFNLEIADATLKVIEIKGVQWSRPTLLWFQD